MCCDLNDNFLVPGPRRNGYPSHLAVPTSHWEDEGSGVQISDVVDGDREETWAETKTRRGKKSGLSHSFTPRSKQTSFVMKIHASQFFIQTGCTMSSAWGKSWIASLSEDRTRRKITYRVLWLHIHVSVEEGCHAEGSKHGRPTEVGIGLPLVFWV